MSASNVIDFRLLQLKAIAKEVTRARSLGQHGLVDERLAEAELVFNALKQERFGAIDLAARARKEW